MKIQIKKIAQVTGHKSSIYTLFAGKKTNEFLSAAGDGWIVEWDLDKVEKGKLLVKVESNIFSMLYLPSIHHIVAGDMDGGVYWVNLDDPTDTLNIAHHEKGVFDIELIQGAVYTAGGQGMLTKWSVEQRRTVESLKVSNQSLRCIAYCESRNEIAIGASDYRIYFIDVENMTINSIIQKAHSNSVFTLKYTPDGKKLISGGRDAMLNVWDLENENKLLNSQPAHWFTINHIAFHPKGHLFATASRDKTIKIWDTKTFELLKVLETARDGGHINSINHLYWSDYKDYLISCSDDRSIIIWEIK